MPSSASNPGRAFLPIPPAGSRPPQTVRFLASTLSRSTVTTTGARNVVDFITDPLTRDWRGFLPNGIAEAASGSIYVDTDGAGGYTQTPGIVEIRQDGAGHVIWQG
jgi:hypothetical protein